MGKFSGENAKTFKSLVQKYVENDVKSVLVGILKKVAEDMVKTIDRAFTMPLGTDEFPVWSANLRDATGVGIYCDGVVQYFCPTKRASQGIKRGKGPFGATLLQQTILNGAAEYSKGVWLVLFSSVPYAFYIDKNGSVIGRGVGFFKSLENHIAAQIILNFKTTKK